MASVLPRIVEKQQRLGLLGNAIRETFLSASTPLKLIEARITDCLESEASQLTEISSYLLHLGGKRVRPLLTTLSAQLFGMQQPSEQLIDAAAGIEMIHMATLLHDDIIDRSPTRRSKPSAYQKYGVPETLLTGDFLLVKAFGLCAKLDAFVVRETERACIELTEGEIFEGKITPNRQIDFEDYLTIIGKKTAALFWLSSGVGAHLSGADTQNVQRMQQFGYHAGLAFQMVDDILDVVAEEDLLGKPSGTDLRQKTPSLVNYLWLSSGDDTARALFETAQPTEEQCEQALAILRDSPVIEEARQIAKKYAAKANANLSELPTDLVDAKVKNRLLALVEYTLERCL